MSREELLEIIKSLGSSAIEECLNDCKVYGLRDLTNKQIKDWLKSKNIKIIEKEKKL